MGMYVVLTEQCADPAGMQKAGSVGKIALFRQIAHAVQRFAGIHVFYEYAFRAGKADAKFLHPGRYYSPAAKAVVSMQRSRFIQRTGHRHAAKLLQIL